MTIHQGRLPRRGFTLVELLVVIAIIGVLVALLLPAIQAAREAARRRQCTNNVKQMALGFMNHESSLSYFPTGGWGFYWVGDPDGGYGKKQPGSWAYNILAYVEQQNLRNNGKGITNAAEKEKALMATITVALPLFNCPSKRPLKTFLVKDRPTGGNYLARNLTSCSNSTNCMVARNDYRVNVGNRNAAEVEGPMTLADADAYFLANAIPVGQEPTGICYRQSLVRMKDLVDGTSNTAMVGEKCLDPALYEDVGTGGLEDQSIYTGNDRENTGLTGSTEDILPRQDAAGVNGSNSDYRFGSAHAGGFNLAMCDGSVQTIDYDVDPTVWRNYGGRDDGQ